MSARWPGPRRRRGLASSPRTSPPMCLQRVVSARTRAL
jgi:hypothetical protein